MKLMKFPVENLSYIPSTRLFSQFRIMTSLSLVYNFIDLEIWH